MKTQKYQTAELQKGWTIICIAPTAKCTPKKTYKTSKRFTKAFQYLSICKCSNCLSSFPGLPFLSELHNSVISTTAVIPLRLVHYETNPHINLLQMKSDWLKSKYSHQITVSLSSKDDRPSSHCHKTQLFPWQHHGATLDNVSDHERVFELNRSKVRCQLMSSDVVKRSDREIVHRYHQSIALMLRRPLFALLNTDSKLIL